jgi:hypothetical protein
MRIPRLAAGPLGTDRSRQPIASRIAVPGQLNRPEQSRWSYPLVRVAARGRVGTPLVAASRPFVASLFFAVPVVGVIVRVAREDRGMRPSDYDDLQAALACVDALRESVPSLRGPQLLEAVCGIEVLTRKTLVSSAECTTSLDQEFVEDFGRFAPAECLSWTVVEFVGDSVEFGLGMAREVSAFGEVLA